MTKTIFRKTLSANDVGSTGGHQGGVLIPKSETELLAFLPPLDAGIKNPNTWLDCIDENSVLQRFKFRYYNNKLHDEGGTRNEYRVTYMTAWLRNVGAKEGDIFEISGTQGEQEYYVKVIPAAVNEVQSDVPVRIKLRGWNRVH